MSRDKHYSFRGIRHQALFFYCSVVHSLKLGTIIFILYFCLLFLNVNIYKIYRFQDTLGIEGITHYYTFQELTSTVPNTYWD